MQIAFVAPPSTSTLIHPVIIAGRWLKTGDENAVVIGNHLLARFPNLKVGDWLTVDIDKKETKWHIVGIYTIVGNVNPPLLYVNYEYLSRIVGRPGQVYSLRVLTTAHDGATQKRVNDQLVALFEEHGIRCIGLPGTIDNDVSFVQKTFGFETAVTEARRATSAANTEAEAARNGIGLVKLMGRDSGFIAAYSVLVGGHVNFCLVPEVPFTLERFLGVLQVAERRSPAEVEERDQPRRQSQGTRNRYHESHARRLLGQRRYSQTGLIERQRQSGQQATHRWLR